MKTIIIILLLIPIKPLDNAYFTTLIQKQWYYEAMLDSMLNSPLMRGENSKQKVKRVNRIRNKIEVVKWLEFGYKLNDKYKDYENN